MTYREDVQTAFEEAIQAGRMTNQQAIDYMYMGTTESGTDLFKNNVTLEYLPRWRHGPTGLQEVAS